MLQREPYDRMAAVRYAHQWAYRRNPLFYDFEELGGDCSSFVSQCVLAGSGIMNFTPTYGWYYIDGNQKSPSWSGVPFFYDFMTRKNPSIGPFGNLCTISQVFPGDVVQLSFDGERFQHTVLVVSTDWPVQADNVFVAAHSNDADNKRLTAYQFERFRCIYFQGVYWP